jgi:hypothetical protein
MNKNVSNLLKNEKGISLIMTFFIMVIILAVVLSICVILYSEVKVMRDVGNSVVSLYAADSGIEKVLYYDRQVLPETSTHCSDSLSCTTGTCDSNGLCLVPRGLCSMFDSVNNNAKYCKPSGYGPDPSIYCTPLSAPSGKYCNPATCTDCTVSFSTNFSDVATNYNTTAVISTAGTSPIFKIQSKGTYGGTGRQVRISISKQPATGSCAGDGAYDGRYCWYLAGENQTCQQTCSKHGGTLSSDCCQEDTNCKLTQFLTNTYNVDPIPPCQPSCPAGYFSSQSPSYYNSCHSKDSCNCTTPSSGGNKIICACVK